MLPRLFDGSCDGDKTHVGCSDDAGFAGAGGGRDVSDGGDSGGGDSGGVDSVGDGGGGGDSVSFLLPTLPVLALACLVVPPPPSSTGDPSPVLSGNLAMADMDHQHHRRHDYNHQNYHHFCLNHFHHHHRSVIMLSFWRWLNSQTHKYFNNIKRDLGNHIFGKQREMNYSTPLLAACLGH